MSAPDTTRIQIQEDPDMERTRSRLTATGNSVVLRNAVTALPASGLIAFSGRRLNTYAC